MKDEVCNEIVSISQSSLLLITDEQMRRLVQLWLTSHCQKQF